LLIKAKVSPKAKKRRVRKEKDSFEVLLERSQKEGW